MHSIGGNFRVQKRSVSVTQKLFHPNLTLKLSLFRVTYWVIKFGRSFEAKPFPKIQFYKIDQRQFLPIVVFLPIKDPWTARYKLVRGHVATPSLELVGFCPWTPYSLLEFNTFVRDFYQISGLINHEFTVQNRV